MTTRPPHPGLLLAVSFAAGVAGGVAAFAWLGTAPPRAATGASLDAPARASSDVGRRAEGRLVERLGDLQAANEMLLARVRELEGREWPSARSPVQGPVSRANLEALREELAALLAAPDSPALASPRFQEHVADALSHIRREEAIEKVRRDQERRTDRLDADVARIEEWLELSPYQSQEMRRALVEQYEREDELRRRWEAGEDEQVLGEIKRADRETFRSEVEVFLGEDQARRFWEKVGGS